VVRAAAQRLALVSDRGHEAVVDGDHGVATDASGTSISLPYAE
jgi:hypothetical protein